MEQWYIIQENVFLFGIFFFICETNIFSGNIFFSYMKRNFFQKKTFFIHETEGMNFSSEVFGGRIFLFMCETEKIGVFRRKKRFRVHCYVSLCMLHMQWIAEPCFKLFPCTSLFVQKTVDMFFYHDKVVRKSQGKKDRSFFHVWNTWGKNHFVSRMEKLKNSPERKSFFSLGFSLLWKKIIWLNTFLCKERNKWGQVIFQDFLFHMWNRLKCYQDKKNVLMLETDWFVFSGNFFLWMKLNELFLRRIFLLLHYFFIRETEWIFGKWL